MSLSFAQKLRTYAALAGPSGIVTVSLTYAGALEVLRKFDAFAASTAGPSDAARRDTRMPELYEVLCGDRSR